jgi:sodium transport system permease protein
VRLDPRVIPLIFGLGITMALAFSALELALGILARSFKEAQSYITPLYLASFLPVVIINSIPGLQPPLALFLIPSVNAVLLFKEALLGQATLAHAVVTLVALLVFAAAAIGLTVNMFTREKVLLKT